MNPVDRLSICYHEAGHAVVADWLGFPVYGLSVDPGKIPDYAAGGANIVIYGADDIQESRAMQSGLKYRREMLLVSTIILMAGNAAMQIHQTGSSKFEFDSGMENGAEDDYQRAYEGAFEFWRNHNRAGAALIGAHFEAVGIIESQWGLVSDTAEALDNKTTIEWQQRSTDSQQIRREALSRIDRFIRNHATAGVA